MTLHPGRPSAGRSETTRSTGQPTRNRQVDVAAIRRDYPIEDVVAAAGIELRPAGHGFVGRCPFHDDTTPSMSVAGVPDRFTCFGCGAHGDVIDFVQRLHGTSPSSRPSTPSPPTTPSHTAGPTGHRQEAFARPASASAEVTGVTGVTAERGFAINALAWRHLSVPVRASFAEQLPAAPPRDRPTPAARRTARRARSARSIPVSRWSGTPATAGPPWSTPCAETGSPPHELTVMDLGQRTRDDRLIDTLRDRIIVPVLDADHRIRGFIGRDISGNPRAPKYRNPTHTPTFDKSQHPVPAHPPRPRPGGTVVIVEGVLDALAIAAAAAAAGRSRQFAPCAANGVTVTAAQVGHILGLAREAHCVIALDGDQAGRDGTAPVAARADHPPRQARLRHPPARRERPRRLAAAPPPRRRPGRLRRSPEPPVDSERRPVPACPRAHPPRRSRPTGAGQHHATASSADRQRIANVCRHLIPLLHQLPPRRSHDGCWSSPSPR